jgi:hypothetical protein
LNTQGLAATFLFIIQDTLVPDILVDILFQDRWFGV